MLNDLHIVDVLLKQVALAVCKGLGDIGSLGVLEQGYFLLYLLILAFCLESCDELVNVRLGALVEALVGFILIVGGSLYAEVT
jgi:peptidoglycan/LPS O-acetylase OafA/YrhL